MGEDRSEWFNAKGEELTDDQKEKIKTLRHNFIVFYRTLQNTIGEGRRQAVVYTHLEEASHMAIKAVTHG